MDPQTDQLLHAVDAARGLRRWAIAPLVMALLVPLTLLWRPVAWWGWLACLLALLAAAGAVVRAHSADGPPRVELVRDEVVVTRGETIRRYRAEELARVLELGTGAVALQRRDGALVELPVVARPKGQEPVGARLARWHVAHVEPSEPVVDAPLTLEWRAWPVLVPFYLAVGGVFATMMGNPALWLVGPASAAGGMLSRVVFRHPRPRVDWSARVLDEAGTGP